MALFFEPRRRPGGVHAELAERDPYPNRFLDLGFYTFYITFMALSDLLTENDLLILTQIVTPNLSDRRRAMRALREDDDILEGMLKDQRIMRFLVDDPLSLLQISPGLFFLVLLSKVAGDMKTRPYTVEKQSRFNTFVFDSDDVLSLLEDRAILEYLAAMLLSFIRINTISIPVRVRKGFWRKYHFSDFDIENLIHYAQLVDEDHRFGPYKRIADVCLFIMGLFPEYVQSPELFESASTSHLRQVSRRSREELTQTGARYYRAAAEHKTARELQLADVLEFLSNHIALLSKPLMVMAMSYLGLLKGQVFLGADPGAGS